MPKIFLFSCIVLLSTTQLKAQVVKDTLREKINYRFYHPLTYSGFQETRYRKKVNNRKSHTAQSKSLPNSLDTVRNNQDYRVSHVAGAKQIKTKPIKIGRVYTHHVGIQVNHLAKIRSGENQGTTLLSNPYGFTYAFRHIKSGYGFDLGVGYGSSYQKIPGLPTVETAEGKTSFRLGAMKQKALGAHWLVGAGIDVLFSPGKEITRSFFGGLIQETSEKKTGLGLGPRATLHYTCWNNRLRLGTEAGWYLEKIKITTREKFSGLPAEVSRSSATSTTFLMPVSVFISIGIR